MKASKFSDAQKAFIIKQRGRWDAGRGDLPEGRDQPGDTQPTEECGSCSGCDAFEPRPAATRPARKKHGIALPQSYAGVRKLARINSWQVRRRSGDRRLARRRQQTRPCFEAWRNGWTRPWRSLRRKSGTPEVSGAHGQHPVADRDLAASTASITKPSLRPVLARIADHPITRISEFLSWNLQITPARTYRMLTLARGLWGN